jgi:formamidopyrimidine-DNA glycosylase
MLQASIYGHCCIAKTQRRSAMPELPEVETTRRGIAPHVEGRRIERLRVRDRRLRWPVPPRLEQKLAGATIRRIGRRAKYLLLDTDRGTALMHLGMTGSLRVLPEPAPPNPHDHYDIELDNGEILRFCDPRRFGSLLWGADTPLAHPLLADLGPEPTDDAFTGDYLHSLSRGRRVAIKPFIMTAQVVVGVGNIYASESLFMAGIHPHRPAGRVSVSRYSRLAAAIREVLAAAIRAGGTTLRDFYGSDGQPGYFRHELKVYDREGLACVDCGSEIRQRVIGQRSSFYCINCQR